jgi:hypothetical protein
MIQGNHAPGAAASLKISSDVICFRWPTIDLGPINRRANLNA